MVRLLLIARYKHLYSAIRKLRGQGLTYAEINTALGENIPKSILTYICPGILLSSQQVSLIQAKQRARLATYRQKAVVKNRLLFNQKVDSYRLKNKRFVSLIKEPDAKLLALSMLYLGEGSKWKSHRGLQLGSANPAIIRLYLSLLHDCYGIGRDSLRARVQHRADQNGAELVKYWSSISGIRTHHFYASYIDKRTIGHKTKSKDYNGVCVVSCAGTNIQLELEQIADIIVKDM